MAGVLKNAFTVGSFTALSRVFGLIREMLQSRLMGAGMEQSAFALSFALPNMMRKLFGEGALTAAFVPVFKDSLENEGHKQAEKLARAVMTTVTMLLLSFVASCFVITGILLNYVTSPRGVLILQLCSILFPYMLAICAAAFGMAVLNSLGKFKASGFMPVILNLVWIAALSILLFLPSNSLSLDARARYISLAVLIGGFSQMAFIFVCMYRAGIKPLPLFSFWRNEKVRLVWRNLGIGALGAGAVQINYMLDQVLAQAASPWAAGVISYAERLMDLPLGIIGVSFGTVLLPAFSGCFAKGDINGARLAFRESVNNQMFLMLPAAAGLFVLSSEVTSLIYEGGKFSDLDTMRVSRAVMAYTAGLAFFGLQKALVPWFQAQKDMKTPLKVSVVSVIINAILNVLAVCLLPEEYRYVGLALSTVVCSFLSSALLIYFTGRKDKSLKVDFSVGYLLKVALASVLMAIIVVVTRELFVSSSNVFVVLSICISAGGISYLCFSFLLGTISTSLLKRFIRR